MLKLITRTLSAATLIGVAGTASAGLMVYDNEAAFNSAAGTLNSEDFESATLSGDGNSVSFAGGSFVCDGAFSGFFCPGDGDPVFFGIRSDASTSDITGDARSGDKSVFFSTPDTATFRFDTPVREFGIFFTGVGDLWEQGQTPSVTSLSLANSNGNSTTILEDYGFAFDLENSLNFAGDNAFFIGIIDDTPFDSVTFSGTLDFDGIYFDDLRFSANTSVPAPGTLLLLSAGAFILARMRARRGAPAATR